MYEPKEGAVAFVEFFSTDPRASKRFLENVFDWKMETEEVAGTEIWFWEAANGPEGHMMRPMGGMPPGTVAFVRVKSVDVVTRKVLKNGGKVLAPKYSVPGRGWFAWYEAPGGVVYAVYQPKPKGRK
jgi:predicted enzyme related to lactoylglutathione lyase